MQSLLMIDPVPAAVILDLMERCSNGMKETEGVISTAMERSMRVHGSTYVLMIARINVPQGRLQESS
jgi:hypothetical protein